MPLRCQTCEKVFQDKAEPCDKGNCRIVEAMTIHYISPDGKGREVTKKIRYGTFNNNNIETTEEQASLRLACNHNGNEQYTIYEPIITCKDCLEFINSRTPKPDIS